MMGASTYDGTYIAAKAIENAGTLNKADIRQALVDLKMPQVVEYMKDGYNLVFQRFPGIPV